MKETPLDLRNGDLKLFGVFHEPEGPKRQLPFVFCHPFAEEKLWSHRVYVSFARELARRGHAVLRFDLAGNGDSDGDFKNCSVEAALRDLGAAIETAKGLTGGNHVALLGLRFGATLAALAAEERSDVRALLLWAPVVDGDRYAQDLLRVNLATQMAVYKEIRHDRAALVEHMRSGETVNVDGYPIGYQLYRQMVAVALARAPRRFAFPTLIVHIDRVAAAREPGELQHLARQYRHATLTTVKEEPFWKEIERFYNVAPDLFSVTLGWLEETSREPTTSREETPSGSFSHMNRPP